MEGYLIKEGEIVLQPGIKEEQVLDETALPKIKETSRCRFIRSNLM